MGKIMVKLISLLALACTFVAGIHGLDVHCDNNKLDECYVKEHLDIHEPTTLNFVDADKWNDVYILNIPSENNNVSIIPSGIFTRFLKLGRIRISTGLKTIQKDDFKNAKALHWLELNDNKLEVIPSNVISEATFLVHINLSDNKLKTIEEFAFNGLMYLGFIYLQRNNLTTLKRNTFAGAENLASVNLHNNQISTIEDGTFSLPNLKQLVLSENFIHTLSDSFLADAPKLISITLSQNGLTHIGQSFYNSNILNTILLEDNSIEDLDLVSFAKMRALKTLTLENTGFSFEKVKETQAFVNSSVTYLDLASNSLSISDVLSRLERLGFVNLQSLNLEGNLFTNIEDIEFIKQKFPNMDQLRLHDNRLTCEWIEAALESLKPQNVEIKQNVQENSIEFKNFKGITCV